MDRFLNTSKTQRQQLFIQGAAGQIEVTVDIPGTASVKGIAMISHPQPLLGGSPQHIVPHTIAKNVCAAGWVAVRPSFRGVGASEGSYYEGAGEAQDTLLVIAHMRALFPGVPLALIGFSFGAYVYAQVACQLEEKAPADTIILMGMPVGHTGGGRVYDVVPIPERAVFIHGESDSTTPLSNILDWARAHRHHPVTVFPGADHFFKGCLNEVVRKLLVLLEAA